MFESKEKRSEYLGRLVVQRRVKNKRIVCSVQLPQSSPYLFDCESERMCRLHRVGSKESSSKKRRKEEILAKQLQSGSLG